MSFCAKIRISMHITLLNISAWLLHYKYFALFPLMVVTGPIVTVVSGSLVAAKIFNFLYAYIVIVAADMAGDSLYYMTGRWGGLNFINKWGHYFGLNAERIENLKKYFEKHGAKTLLFGKFTQIFGSIILVSAGIAKIPYATFFFYNLLATLVKSLFFLLIGFYFIQIYLRIRLYSDYIAAIFTIFVVLVIIGYNFYIRKRIDKEFK